MICKFLTIDEYPYVARSSKSLTSTLQLLIDQYKDSSKLMLILCGSSMSYMEDHVLAYGIVGGTPQYLLQMDDRKSIEENIKNTFLNPISFLFEEPENLLKQEVREPALYNAIITAIATGASRMAEISTKVGEDTSVCVTYLKNLVALGLVRKETPYGEKASRKSIYFIDDNMFRFWYRFIPENSSMIVRGAVDVVYKRMEPHLSDYMGKVFAECKWTNEKVDAGVLEKLAEKSRLFHYRNTHLYLFAKNGFTGGCEEKGGEMGNVKMVSYSDIIKLLG